MIIAHRLLKSEVNSDEYILMTEPCCDAIGHKDTIPDLQWTKSSHEFHESGKINYEVVKLSDYKTRIPSPPATPGFVVDKRSNWLEGVDSINLEMTT